MSIPFAVLQSKLEGYLPPHQIALIVQAFELATEAHQGQLRSSGEPYIIHPVAVADILADMRMDYQSIMAAILHDVIEESPIDKTRLAQQFGEEVAALVDGVSKLEQLQVQNRAQAQAENLRKMMLAMTRDIRVILIKLADRLHNMRTLFALSPEKSQRIAKETIEIYAPIANRLGMNRFKIELEDIGFKVLHPMRYRVLTEALQKTKQNRDSLIHEIESNIRVQCEAKNIQTVSIQGREKQVYSLYLKMQKKELSLHEILDIYAIRLIVKSVDDCYRALGLIHTQYRPMHGRFKDYIAVPKSNGYQSLHTTVIGQYGLPIEIQIRTEDMHKFAENGIAAHWLYKWGKDSHQVRELNAHKWLKHIEELQAQTGNSLEFVENMKMDLYPDAVYVFTPTGDILSLPAGSTPVDFAYAVHTDVGNACIASKIDRRLVPLSTPLNSGQTVEIITARGAQPNPAWLAFVATAKARSHIRHFLKNQAWHEAKALGKQLLDKALLALSTSMDTISSEKLSTLLSDLKLKSLEHLWVEVGLGNQMAALLARRLVESESEVESWSTSVHQPLPIKGTEGMLVSYAKCCKPIPGDAILGFLSTGRGIVVHRRICKNAIELARSPEKTILISWATETEGDFLSDLRVDVINRKGALAAVANTIADKGANIQNLHIDERDVHHNTLYFSIQLKNRKQLAEIMRQLRELPMVTKVSRCVS